MKKFLLFSFLTVLLNIVLFINSKSQNKNDSNSEIIELLPQHSLSYKERPKNVDEGIIINDSKSQVLITGVPSYLWRHGCGPTALGMVVGYYDANGYSDLITGNASTQTSDVNNAIANNEHYNDYSLPIDNYPDLFQDKSELGGAHTSNCIADYMHTSWSLDQNRYGWSYSNKISVAFTSYIQQMNSNYTTYTTYIYFGSTNSWDTYKNEINNNNPVVLLVDSDGDGSTDHFVTGIGYDDANNTYAIYDTWDHNVHWYQWRAMSGSYTWGVYGFNILHINSNQQELADLLPYQPNNQTWYWEDKIIVKNELASDYHYLSDNTIKVGDNIYVSFSFANISNVSIENQFNCKIYIDGNERFTATQTSTVSPNTFWVFYNYGVTNDLSIGNHTITLSIDANNVVDESNETNNSYSKDFSVISNSAINSISKNSIKIYPNPATEFIGIEISENKQIEKVTILDINGKKIINQNNFQPTINVNSFKSGTYFVVIKTTDEVLIQKFIKE